MSDEAASKGGGLDPESVLLHAEAIVEGEAKAVELEGRIHTQAVEFSADITELNSRIYRRLGRSVDRATGMSLVKVYEQKDRIVKAAVFSAGIACGYALSSYLLNRTRR